MLKAALRKENMLTPCTLTGYWNARKSPFLTRLSGVRPTMLSPSMSTCPEVTRYFGCPIRV